MPWHDPTPSYNGDRSCDSDGMDTSVLKHVYSILIGKMTIGIPNLKNRF
jgi:hypothetical protein